MVSREITPSFQPSKLKKPWDLLDLLHYLNKVVVDWVYDDPLFEALEELTQKWMEKRKIIPKNHNSAYHFATDTLQIARNKFKIGARANDGGVYRYMHSTVTCKYLLEESKACKLTPIFSETQMEYLKKEYVNFSQSFVIL